MIRRSAPLLVLFACGGAGPNPSTTSGDGGVDAWTVDGAPNVKKARRITSSDECFGAVPENPLGCDYYFFHQVQEVGVKQPTKCLAVLLANVSSSAATVTVEFRGKSGNVADVVRVVSGVGPNPNYAPLPPSGIPPGEVGVVSLSQGWNDGANGLCPSKAVAMHDSTVPLQPEGFGQAFRIHTSVPVAAYAINYFASRDVGNDSGVALRSVHSWGRRYVLPGTMTPTPRPFTNIARPSFTSVIASQDGTTVLIGGIKYALSLRGDVYTFTDDDQWIGEVIEADKPVAVFAGSAIAQIPVDAEPGDPTVHQVPPPSQWGFEYVGVRYRDRWEDSPFFQPGDEDAPLWRLLAEQDTTLSYEPARPAGAPTSLEAGKLHTFFATGPFIVRSAAQNPFYFAQTMTSGRYPGPPSRPDQDGNPGGIGDVEVVPVLPRSEWSNRYVFFPDPTHPETNLVLVRHRQKDGTFASVTLDCAGVLGGWQVVGADYEYTRIDLSRGDFEPQTYSGGTCRNQIARLSSSGAFQLTVWGWGNGQTSEFPSGVSSYAWTARGFPFIEH